MARPAIRVEGLDLVNANLRRIISKFVSERREIHQTVGQPVLLRARQRARARTGTMRSTIRLDATGEQVEITAGEGIDYAGYQHYGTRFVTPNRFLTGPLNELESKMVRDYQRLTDRFIAREWRSNT